MAQRVGAYQVGVDLGTTWTAAAVCRAGGPAELVALGDRGPAAPSIAFVGDGGDFAIGQAAVRQAAAEPTRVVEEFTRRIGDRTPLVVNGESIAAEALAARFVGRVLQGVVEREGGRAAGVALTHPAGWGPHKLALLREALAEHGLPGVLLLPEPQAAAIGCASAARVAPGSVIAVYDLGGGTFDAAVLRTADQAGRFELLGRPEGIDRLGGVDFDEAVFDHVQTELGADWDALDPTDDTVLAAVGGLRRECTAAKEALSQDTEVTIPVTLPGVHRVVRLDRARFEDMIRPALDETVAALGRAIAAAGLPDSVVPTVVLAGGSSRIPLVRALVERELGLRAVVDVDPKGVIAVGAALAARDAAAGRSAPAAPGPPDRAGADPARRTAPVAAAAAGFIPTVVPSAAVTPPAADVLRAEPATRPDLVAPPVGVRPFRQPDAPQRRRWPMVLSAVAAGVLALGAGGGVLAYVTRDVPVAPAGSTAEASTPASLSPAATVAPTAGPPRPPAQAPQEVRPTTAAPTPTPATPTTTPAGETTAPAPDAGEEPEEPTDAPDPTDTPDPSATDPGADAPGADPGGAAEEDAQAVEPASAPNR